MRNTFLITALGRCGTMWLSRVMNMSKQWTVAHEPINAQPKEYAPWLGRRFVDHYGEVNSRMRWIAMDVPVTKRGVIIRDPVDHMVSLWNKASYLKTIKHPRAGRTLRPGVYRADLEIIDGLVQAGVPVIRFEQMTTDPEYLGRVLRYYGITDVDPVDAGRRANKNTVKKKVAQTWDDVPENIQQLLGEQSNWYWEKYYGAESAQHIPNPI